MRLILTTIILTLLAQPVWAFSVEELIEPCTDWKDIGYKNGFTRDDKGMNALLCATYMAAMEEAGKQHCSIRSDFTEPEFRWWASNAQLAQYLLNKASEKPEEWRYGAYGFFLMNEASKTFPCKE